MFSSLGGFFHIPYDSNMDSFEYSTIILDIVSPPLSNDKIRSLSGNAAVHDASICNRVNAFLSIYLYNWLLDVEILRIPQDRFIPLVYW